MPENLPADAGRPCAALAALSAAAWLLPGLAPAPALAQPAAEDAMAAQVSRYQEGLRVVPGAPNRMAPLSAQTLMLSGRTATAAGDLSLDCQQDSWSGATPVATAPASALGNRPVLGAADGALVVVGASPMVNGSVLLDRGLRPVRRDAAGQLQHDDRRVHTLASASPEVRQQLDARLARPLADGQWSAALGVSQERDFRSRTAAIGRRFEFDERRGTLSLRLAHTRSAIGAVLDHDASPYITRLGHAHRLVQRGAQQLLHGVRNEWALDAGISRVLGQGALFEARLQHRDARGDLNNPYKLTSVIFVAPEALAAAGPDDALAGNLQALLERRPERRRQWQFDGTLVLHHAGSDGALHLGAGHFRDDWGMRSHRLQAQWLQPLPGGWMAAARARYHTQRAARFYAPWLVSAQVYRRATIGPDGQPQVTLFDPALLPAHHSSDARLAGFGSLSGGLSLTRTLADGLLLELGWDATRQSARLKAGGPGDADVAELRHRMLHVGLRWALDGVGGGGGGGSQAVGPDGAAVGAAGGRAGRGTALQPPASLMSMHGLEPAPAGHEAHADPEAHGAAHGWMLGWRLLQRKEGPALQQHGGRVGDAQAAAACGDRPCLTRPAGMQMRMHMLELMRGLNPELTLMLMPQLMAMRMDMALLPGAVAGDVPVHFGRHESAGLGDTQLHLLWHPVGDSSPGARWQGAGLGRWQFGLGVSLPTGRSDLRHRRMHQQQGQPLAPTMQPGSGSLDWLPGLAWQAEAGGWAGGVQAQAVLRSGWQARESWRLGHQLQVDGWLAHRLSPRWQASLRIGQRRVGAMQGRPAVAELTAQSADEVLANSGGRVTDAGLGLRWSAPAGGPGSVAVEWSVPVQARLEGVQAERRSSLALSWSQHF